MAQRAAELRRKLDGLTLEFGHWEDESGDGKVLRKHSSQIRRITNTLRGAVAELHLDLQAAQSAGEAEGLAVERMILDVHRIWEFFRSKLAQRWVPWLRPYLAAADELAVACYEPAVAAAGLVGREPPLVFLNGGWSPYAVRRGSSYRLEAVPGAALPVPKLRVLLQSLPVPVIGVPWFQVQHLPDLVAIGHEVGHTVEDDLELGEPLTRVLAAGAELPVERQAAWLSWRREVFADVYGILALGPAFAQHLVDFLPTLPAEFQEDAAAEPWGAYPGTRTRARLAIETVRACGFERRAAELESQGVHTPGSTGFAGDAGRVALALLESAPAPFSGRRLRDVLAFTADNEDRAAGTAELLSACRDPVRLDVRELIAGARIAFVTSPETYQESNAQGRLLDWIEQHQSPLRRARRAEAGLEPGVEAGDREAGRRLVARMATLSGAVRPAPKQRGTGT